MRLGRSRTRTSRRWLGGGACLFIRMPVPSGRCWSTAESEDGGTPASLQVTAGRDAYAAGRDLYARPASPAQSGDEERPGTRVDGPAGVQAGSGNVQVNNYGGKAAGAAQAAFPAQFTQRAIPLHDGLRAGTMLAIEVRAHHELEQAAVVMSGAAGSPGAATIPPPAAVLVPLPRGIDHDRPGRFRPHQCRPDGSHASWCRHGDTRPRPPLDPAGRAVGGPVATHGAQVSRVVSHSVIQCEPC